MLLSQINLIFSDAFRKRESIFFLFDPDFLKKFLKTS